MVGLINVGGVDEVGRGPLAGPVVACTAVFRGPIKIEGLRDSKKLSARQRARLKGEILENAMEISVAFISEKRIDEMNIYQASLQAMQDSVNALNAQPDGLKVDAVKIPGLNIPQEAIIKGDSTIPEIMAASIIAKEARDEYMQRLGEQYPGYGLEKHMGYGTRQHLEAIRELGILDCHRRSFKPVMEVIFQSEENILKELEFANSAGVINFVKRARSMGFEDKVRRFHSLLNKVLADRG